MWPREVLRASTPTHSRAECPSTPRTEVTRPPRGTVIAAFTAADSISAKSLEDLLNAPKKKQQHSGDKKGDSCDSVADAADDDDDGYAPVPPVERERYDHDDGCDFGSFSRRSDGTAVPWPSADDERTIRTVPPPPATSSILATRQFQQAQPPVAVVAPFSPLPDAELVDSISALTVDNTPVRKRLTLACCADPNSRGGNLAKGAADTHFRRQGLAIFTSQKIGTKRRSYRDDSDGGDHHGCDCRSVSTPLSPQRRTAGSIVASTSFDDADAGSPIRKKRPHDTRE